MAYTTVDKIKAMFRAIDMVDATGDADNDTAIITEEVTQFITEAESRINAKIKQYYATPITGPESLNILIISDVLLFCSGLNSSIVFILFLSPIITKDEYLLQLSLLKGSFITIPLSYAVIHWPINSFLPHVSGILFSLLEFKYLYLKLERPLKQCSIT